MGDFFHALTDPGLPFLRNALLVGLLASVGFGVVGTYVVVRRISYLAGAIAHSALGGIGFALYAQRVLGWAWMHPLLGAGIAALTSALVMAWATLWAREREDAVISALWATGMGAGLLFLSATPGYVDPMSYLFGDVLLVGGWQVWVVAGLDLVVLVLGLGLYRRFQALAFDEEFTRLRGVSARAYGVLLLCLVALSVVLLVTVVGVVLVVALLTLPAAAAGRGSRSLRQMMAVATSIGFMCVFAGMATSYQFNAPAGPVIVIFVAASYMAAWAVKRKTS